MLKRIRTMMVMIAALVLPVPVFAADTVAPAFADSSWIASYWNNTALSGSAVLNRSEGDIDHRWGYGAPDYMVNTDGFSARWVRRIDFMSGFYRFTATSDDGVRVWIDNELIINEWSTHPVKTVNANRSMSAGEHLLVVEYFEDTGQAQVSFSWQSVGSNIVNWRGEYYNNTTLGGAPVMVRDDAQISFTWQSGSPAPGVVNGDNFSVRWTRTLDLPAGMHRFKMATDDGGRLWVNNQLVLDYWQIQPATTREAAISLPGGQTAIRMEYYEASGNAAASLSWDYTPVPSTIYNWRGEYFNNASLGGSPALVRDDPSINFNWRDGSPAAGTINADNFSVRWTRSINMAAGWYRFSMTVDDGGRLWVNDQLLLDTWQVQSQQTYAANIYLPGGATSIRMEYFDSAGLAAAVLSWAQSDTVIRNWRGEYFNNVSLNGTPALLRDDGDVNFNWELGSPSPGAINTDGFSVRWTRSLNLPAGRYRFVVTSDDGVRLWVNDQLIVDVWRIQPATANAGEIDLPGGAVGIRLEYFDGGGTASARLTWTQSTPNIDNWRGEYFNNTGMSGTPVLVRDDTNINFNWDVGSPAPDVVGIDTFSVRWTRTLSFIPGWYRFTVTSDDGSRLYVNNQLLINAWQVQVAQRYTADVYLSGATPVRMEYYEDSGVASARLSWEPIGAAITNWRGEYFNNVNLTGPAVLVRDDQDVNFNWGDNSPAPGVVNADTFSARWTRAVNLSAGWYRFTIIPDDGARLWVNNRLLIDAWQVQGPRPYDGEIYLSGGDTTIKLEYFENTGWASIQLAWRGIPQATQQQTAIVDDTDAGFDRNRVADWNTAPEGYGSRLTWSRNADAARSDTNTARWYARLAPGRYEVFAFIPERYTTTSQARYVVSHAEGRTVRAVSQAANGDRWVSLGTYRFRGNEEDYVELTDVTFEPDKTLLVAFDAMKWEPR
ncbi:MAG: PA14 domain-containing protein [Chloroflexi bacterium]|nr:PA14 domain-containing protein [Chloroflexota bacterium]